MQRCTVKARQRIYVLDISLENNQRKVRILNYLYTWNTFDTCGTVHVTHETHAHRFINLLQFITNRTIIQKIANKFEII